MRITIEEDKALAETEVVIRCPRVDGQVRRALEALRAVDRKITGQREGQTFPLDAADLLYADTADKRTFLYTAEAVYETPLRLYELEERLAAYDFFRATKSSVVNFNAIRSLRPDLGGRMVVTLSNGERLPVSRQYVPFIKKKLGL